MTETSHYLIFPELEYYAQKSSDNYIINVSTILYKTNYDNYDRFSLKNYKKDSIYRKALDCTKSTIFDKKKGFIFSGNEFKGETRVEKGGRSARKGTRIRLNEPYNVKGHIISNARVIQDRQIGKNIRLFDILLDKPIIWEDDRMVIKQKKLPTCLIRDIPKTKFEVIYNPRTEVIKNYGYKFKKDIKERIKLAVDSELYTDPKIRYIPNSKVPQDTVMAFKWILSNAMDRTFKKDVVFMPEQIDKSKIPLRILNKLNKNRYIKKRAYVKREQLPKDLYFVINSIKNIKFIEKPTVLRDNNYNSPNYKKLVIDVKIEVNLDLKIVPPPKTKEELEKETKFDRQKEKILSSIKKVPQMCNNRKQKIKSLWNEIVSPFFPES